MTDKRHPVPVRWTADAECQWCNGAGFRVSRRRIGWWPGSDVIHVREICGCVQPEEAEP